MTAPRWTLGLAISAALLGATHLALAPLAYKTWTTDALWFVGTGLAILIAALTNIVGLSAAHSRARAMIVAVDLLMAGFFAAAWFVLPGPQVIVGFALFLALTNSNLRTRPVADGRFHADL